MAASKNTSNSSKTAHVMNLLRKNEPTDPAEGSNAGAPSPVPAPSPAPAPQVPPIVTSLNADAEISDQIRDALETALEDAVEAEAPPAKEAPPAPAAPSVEPPVGQAAPVSPGPAAEAEEDLFEPFVAEEMPPEAPEEAPAVAVPEDIGSEAAVPEAAGPAEAAPQPAAEEAPAPAPEPPPKAFDPNIPVLHNVMQRLVEMRAQKYMDLFGLCQCDRCKSDVLALTLNNLRPRYIVISSSGLSPLLDMYGNRFNGEITAQLLHACKQVMESPRH